MSNKNDFVSRNAIQRLEDEIDAQTIRSAITEIKRLRAELSTMQKIKSELYEALDEANQILLIARKCLPNPDTAIRDASANYATLLAKARGESS